VCLIFEYYPAMDPIGKISNARATLARKLHQKKHRDAMGMFIAEGNRTVEQILLNRLVEVDFLVAKAGSEWCSTNELLIRKAFSGPISENGTDSDSVNGGSPIQPEVVEADEKLFQELADTSSPQDVLAVCRIPEPAIASDLLAGEGVILALYQLGDPGNLGTIMRTAAWFGVRGMFMSTGTVDLYNPKVIRSMAGSVGAIPVASGYLAIFLEEAKKEGWRVFLLDAGIGSKGLSTIRPGKKSVLVLGSEAHGLPEPILGAYERIRIEPGTCYDQSTQRDTAGITSSRNRAVDRHNTATPGQEHQPAKTSQTAVESLNAAVAASVALYRLTIVKK
jgi:RNA methyltransferase, TrmH family